MAKTAWLRSMAFCGLVGVGRVPWIILAGAAISFAPACTGRVGGGPMPSSGHPSDGIPASPGDDPGPPGAAHCGSEVGAVPLRRLTRGEYDRVVQDLMGLGLAASPAKGFLPDDKVTRFNTNALPISESGVDDYRQSAETLAAAVDIEALVACRPADEAAERACLRQFLSGFGLRAYRRPLTAEEAARYLTLFQDERTRSGFPGSMRLVLEAMLQAPGFLYHAESGTSPVGGAKMAALDPYSLAARLSFFFLGSGPDDLLLAAAAENRLATPEAVEAEARRLLKNARAREVVRRFHLEWLGLDRLAAAQKDPNRYPEFGPSLQTAMLADTQAFVDEVVWNAGGKLETLFTAEYSFPPAPLLPVYGLAETGGSSGAGGKRNLDPSQRAGLLTQPSVLAVADGIVRRGKFVREAVLCQEIPPPPPDVNPKLVVANTSATVRERFAMHEQNPACGGCHKLLDPIGFGFSRYDGIGSFQASDAAGPIDPSGEVVAVPGADGPFNGPVELGHRLATAEALRSCLVKQWFVFGLGHEPAAEDGCSLRQAAAPFAAAGYDVRELMIGIARSEAFRFKKVTP